MIHNVSRWTLAGAAAACLLITGCLPIELSVSPKGEVLVARQEGFFVMNPASGQTRRVLKPKADQPAFGAFSPDGKKILAVNQSKTGGGFGMNFRFLVADVADGKAKHLGQSVNVTYAAWTKDGKTILYTRLAQQKKAPLEENMPELVVIDPASGEHRVVAGNLSAMFRNFGDGQHVLAFAIEAKNKETNHYSGHLSKINLKTGKATKLASVLGGKSVFFDLSPDGKKALFTAVKAAAPGSKLEAKQQDKPVLFELDLSKPAVRVALAEAPAAPGKQAAGGVRMNMGGGAGIVFARYAPKGSRALIGVKGENDLLNLFVYDGGVKGKPVLAASDAAKSAGSGFGQGAEIYPVWIDEDRIAYIAHRAVFGTQGKNLELVQVRHDGQKRQGLQAALDTGASKAGAVN